MSSLGRLTQTFLLYIFALAARAAVNTSEKAAEEVPPPDLGPWQDFKTEPSFKPSILNISTITDDLSQLSSGYIFIAPYVASFDIGGFGVQIFDRAGDLVWYGNDTVNPGGRVMDPSVCDYLGQKANHLCFSEAHEMEYGEDGAQHRIFDNTYTPVHEDYSTAGTFQFPNPHEFNMLPGGESFLQVVYQRKTMDLTPYQGSKEGYFLDGCFQEIDVRSGKATFEWCATDHVDIWETTIFLRLDEQKTNLTSKIAGNGTVVEPWDPMHINAVDKTDEGDYFASIRHLDQIIKIAGVDSNSGQEPGSMIWRLGGLRGNIDHGNFTFSKQHHVRLQNMTNTETTLSFLNNAWEGINAPTSPASAGQIVVVNNETKTARLEMEWPNPRNYTSASQGAVHLQDNGNVFVGWGNIPQITEFAGNGTVLFDAQYTSGIEQSYRSFKFPWQGKPKTLPKLVAYQKICKTSEDTPLVAYVSWNGATEVDSWRFTVSTRDQKGPWLEAGTFKRAGFETKAQLPPQPSIASGFTRWVAVDALDVSGMVLETVQTMTFVPQKNISSYCDSSACGGLPRFDYSTELSCADGCGESIAAPLFVLCILIVAIESLNVLFQNIWYRTADAGTRVYQSLDAREKPAGLSLLPFGAKQPSAKRFGNGKEPVDRGKLAEPPVASRAEA